MVDWEKMETFGRVLGESEIVKGGLVVQIGPRPGKLDAHVRTNMLILVCDDPPMEVAFNDEDAEILLRVASVAARRTTLAELAAACSPEPGDT